MTTATAAAVLASTLFAFHSNEWLNLHHFMRAVARGEPATAALTAPEKVAWEASVALYRERYARRDLVFDEGLISAKAALRRAEGRSTLAGLGLEPQLAVALERAAPVYRRHWWPQHDRENREWIAAVLPQVNAHGAALARGVAAAYGRSWPAEPVAVDLSVHAGAVGAYTTGPPTHVTISPQRDVNRLGALELLFHEASHAWDDVVEKGVARAAAAQGRTAPPRLWHAVLFFTAGELTRRELAAYGDEDYVELGLRSGVYARACGDCRALLAKHWGPRLDGRVSVDDALAALVSATSKQR